jgi:4'-phosphopantetheinyl transferase
MFTPFELPVDGEVRVFGAVIPPALIDRDVFEWLSPQDAAALAAFGSRRRRAQFAVGRWLLQHAAARTFGAGWELRTIGHGPQIVSPRASAVSISHSGDMVLCAAGRVAALGVDVERIRERREPSMLAAAVLHPAERSGLAALPASQRWTRFYRAWTCKEAIAKALGVGVFGLSFDRIRTGDGRVLQAPPEELPAFERWRVRELDVGEALAAAVAWHT